VSSRRGLSSCDLDRSRQSRFGAIHARHYAIVIAVGGLVLISMGVLIWTGEFARLNVTVSEWLQTLGLPNFSSDT